MLAGGGEPKLRRASLALESERAGQLLLEELGRRFSLRRDRPHQAERLYFDTFDWEIFRSGGVLYATARNGRTLLRWVSSAETRQLLLPAAQVPAFAADFPVGEFRRALEKVTGIRRLLPLVRLDLVAESARVLDRRQKTVVRATLETRSAASPGEGGEPRPLVPLLRVQPVKGYEPEWAEVVGHLERHRDLARGVSVSELEESLAAIGREPVDYISKPRVALAPDEPAREGVARILRFLLDIVIANEEGIRRDLDTEFLHDFRVAIRRTRSALSQIRGVLAESAVERFKREFSRLGQLTGPLRDLDVFLLKMGDYRADLPASTGGDLEPLEQFLAARREVALRRLVEGLDSGRYRNLLRDWREFLEGVSEPDSSAPSGELPIAVVSAREIRRVYRRVLKRGAAIDDASPASALHRLRIECKKLRYLLEFFRGLYEGEGIDEVIGALKQLQDNLGDFNDFGVQQRMLSQLAHEMDKEGVGSVEVLMAMGRLVQRLEQGEARERRRFGKRFRTFSSRENRDRFDLLLAAATPESTSG
jgi:CHAD domain-containing protein